MTGAILARFLHLLLLCVGTTCSRSREHVDPSIGGGGTELRDGRPLPGVVSDSPKFRSAWLPESIAITYGNVDVKVNESFVAIPGRGLTSTCDPDFDAPRYDSYADGVDRRFVTVTSCGEWYENLNIVLELVRTPDGWRVHGAGMHLSTDNMIWLGQDLWLRPLTGSIRIDCDDADGSPRVRSSLRLSADVESPHDRGPCHYAANATFQVAFTPVLPIAPPFVRAYAEAAAKTARR